MEILFRGDARALGIVAKMKVDPEAEYRVSDHVLIHSKDGRHLVRQFLTKQAVRLTDGEFELLTRAQGCCVTGREIIDAGYEELVRSCYLVTRDSDECAEYLRTLELIRLMTKTVPGTAAYTILTTTACNARCVYCFEEGIKPVTMNREMADHVVDFICRTKHDGKIFLKWFGGEPLLTPGIISHICRSLGERGVEYESKMTTNASLFTPEMAHEAKELWHLGLVQVSLDGHRSDYESRKKYVDPVRFNYDTVMRAVHYLLDEDIKVVLRCNYDEENLSRFEEFIEDVSREFGGDVKPLVYLNPLYQNRRPDSFEKMIRREIEIRDKFIERGFRNYREERKIQFKTNACMADSCGRSVVINADGELYRCEHLIGSCGNILDGRGVAEREEFKVKPSVTDECRRCTFLPHCTPFSKTGCPNKSGPTCKMLVRLNAERMLDLLVKDQS